ncbi:hypothetical protein [Paraburkholderia sp.]|jgi:hypothetical protein|uniref:hypothetical protein n=1 Tax=Paraburkholderia sp. TaxID=1926495 RepID=UPI002F429B42
MGLMELMVLPSRAYEVKLAPPPAPFSALRFEGDDGVSRLYRTTMEANMKNTSNFIKLVFAILCMGNSKFGAADTLLTFNDPYLMAITSNGNVTGYYGAKNDQFCCFVFFASPSQNFVTSKDRGFDLTLIRTFTSDHRKSSFEYTHRDTEFDITGTLFTRQSEWILQTSSIPPGCANVTGSFLNGPEAPGAQRFLIAKKVSAPGIQVVPKKTFFYNKSGNIFSNRIGFLTR